MAVSFACMQFCILLGCFLGLFVIHAVGNSLKTYVSVYKLKLYAMQESGQAVLTEEQRMHLGFPFFAAQYFYFIGGILAPLPVGYLALNFSASFLFGVLMLTASLLNLFFITGIEYNNLILLRTVLSFEGMVQASLTPVVLVLLAKWTSKRYRIMQVTIIMAAVYIGDLVGEIVGAALVNTGRWSLLAHTHSVVTLLVFLFWVGITSINAASNEISASNILPDNHFDVLDSINGLKPLNDFTANFRFSAVPWMTILRSKPVVALCYTSFAFYLLYYSAPLITDRLGYHARDSVLTWSLPSTLLVLSSVVSGTIGIGLRAQNVFSATQIRRFLVCGGLCLEAIFLTCIAVAVSFGDRWGASKLILALLTLGIGFSGWTFSSLQVNPVELSLKYVSIIAGLASTISSFAGLIATAICQKEPSDRITNILEKESLHQVEVLFLVLSILIWSAAIVYGLLSQSERQAWDEDPSVYKDIYPQVVKIPAINNFVYPKRKNGLRGSGGKLTYTATVLQQTDF